MRNIISVTIALTLLSCTSSKNGPSVSRGSVKNGSLKNAAEFDYKNPDYKFFSFISYYFLNRAHVHHKIKKANELCYASLKKKYPDYSWKIMECSKKNGGRMKPHRTHQNGTSIDYMTPLKWVKSGKQYKGKDWMGVWHYGLTFDENGYLNRRKKTVIDFDKIAEHILTLQKHCKKNGMRIKKVIFKINLKDNLFASKHGKKLKKSGIYFARYLSPIVDNIHDDHYHIDFAFTK